MRAFHYLTPWGVLQVELWPALTTAVCQLIPTELWRAGQYVAPARAVREWEQGEYSPFGVDRDAIPRDWPVQEVEV